MAYENTTPANQPDENEKELSQEGLKKLENYIQIKKIRSQANTAQMSLTWHVISKCLHLPCCQNELYTLDAKTDLEIETFRGKYRSAIEAQIMDCVAVYNTYTTDSASNNYVSLSARKRHGYDPNNDQEFARFIADDVMPEVYGLFNDPDTNFERSTLRRHTEAFIYGTSCRYIRNYIDDKNRRRIEFNHVPIKTMFWEYGPGRKLVFAGREMELTLEEAAELWGETAIREATKIFDDSWRDVAAEKTAVFTHVVMRNKYLPAETGEKSNYVGYVLYQNKIIASTDNLEFMPYIISEFIPGVSNNHFGWSPMFSIARIISKNDEIIEDLGAAISYSTMPAMMTVKGTPVKPGDLAKGNVLPVLKINEYDGKINRYLEPIPLSFNNMDAAKLVLMNKQDISDRLLFGNMITPQETSGLTETQVQELITAHNTRLRPAIQTYVNQDMIPVMRHVLSYIFSTQGLGITIPEDIDVPEEIRNNPHTELDIEYSGLLSAERKRHTSLMTTNVIVDTANISSVLSQHPNLAAKYDFDKIVNLKIEAATLDRGITRSRKAEKAMMSSMSNRDTAISDDAIAERILKALT